MTKKGAFTSAFFIVPEREKLVLTLYYQEELNLKEIGAVLEVGESRVSQLHSQAIKRLRTKLGKL
ncbi:RNA polymerase sigma factor WhiG [Escherichia coli Nissle 1917]|nr:sigma-70 family RNA polymerase sigma factor [Escherichia coli]AID79007.1 RNA polymerase sigma factor WhiG [Escherichia coli Nissle 1917]